MSEQEEKEERKYDKKNGKVEKKNLGKKGRKHLVDLGGEKERKK